MSESNQQKKSFNFGALIAFIITFSFLSLPNIFVYHKEKERQQDILFEEISSTLEIINMLVKSFIDSKGYLPTSLNELKNEELLEEKFKNPFSSQNYDANINYYQGYYTVSFYNSDLLNDNLCYQLKDILTFDYFYNVSHEILECNQYNFEIKFNVDYKKLRNK